MEKLAQKIGFKGDIYTNYIFSTEFLSVKISNSEIKKMKKVVFLLNRI